MSPTNNTILLSDLLNVYGNIYRDLAELFAAAEREPEKADTYYKECLKVVVDIVGETELTLLLLAPVNEVYVKYTHDWIGSKIFIYNAVNIINDYVIKNGINLTDFVNSISWNNGYIPFDWAMLCKINGYNISNWNIEFGTYVPECSPSLWNVNETPPYVNASISNAKLPRSMININGRYRLVQDSSAYSEGKKFIYDDGYIKIEYTPYEND